MSASGKYRCLLTDLDNTLYSWVDYFAPCFRAMVHALQRELNVQEQTLIEDFRNVYSRHKSVEYAFSVQELDTCKGLPRSDINELIRIAKGAFAHTRTKNLKAYEGVRETLQWARKSDLLVIAVTNAPWFQASRRLQQLSIDPYIFGLAAWRDEELPQDGLDSTELIAQRKASGEYRSRIPAENIWRLESKQLKPNPASYEIVLSALGIPPERAAVLGDSIAKDLLPAERLGCTSVWAQYGTIVEEKNMNTILKITHWDQKRVQDTYQYDVYTPDFSIARIEEIKAILRPPVPTLFDFA